MKIKLKKLEFPQKEKRPERAFGRRKEKPSMPKRDYRKFFRCVLWITFVLVFFGSIVSIIRTIRFDEKLNNVTDNLMNEVNAFYEEQEVQESIVNTEGAKKFASDFIKQYYTWSFGEDKVTERSERLSKYLLNGLDEQAGLHINDVTCQSSVSGVSVWKMEETGSDACDVTLIVSYTLKEQVKRESTVTKTNEEGGEVQEVVTKMVEEDKGSYQKYVVVPLCTDGQNFVVSAIPYIVTAPTAVVMTEIDDEEAAKEQEDNITFDETLTIEVTGFCETFLKVLTSGSQAELDYYTGTNADILSLTGIYSFESLTDLMMYEKENSIEVKGTMTLVEASTNATVLLPVEIHLQKQAERYVVQSIND